MTRFHGHIRLRVLPWLILGLLLGSCSGLALPGRNPTSETLPTSLPTNTLPPVVTAVPLETPIGASAGPYRLMVWVPPQFDPNSGSPAGDLLKQRLQDFTRRMPGVQIDVRVKAETGPGGLYDSLATASAAAPNARPDLIALPQDTLQASALKGLLQPFDGLTIAMSDPDWYDYARQLANLQTIQFGMPFAGDALLLAHRPSVIEKPPTDWSTVLDSQNPLIFSAADPQALYTLSQYQAAGGFTSDDQGRPALDADTLTGVLDFVARANQAGVMPGWLAEIQNPAQAWQAFQEGRADQAVTWATQYLPAAGGGTADQSQAIDLAAAPLPTPTGEPLTLATGWVWALGDTHSPHQELATRLAEFLSESSFLAKWTQAAGYLPPRPSALQAWTNPPAPEGFTWQAQLQPILESARLYPPIEVLSNLGPVLQQATLQVLSGQADPAAAAHSAVESTSNP